MRIWLINHYAVPPKYYPLARTATFAKYLKRMGHDVTIFAASTVHNSNINLITDNLQYKEIEDEGINYVLVKCKGYKGNGVKRILNMFEFANKLERICDKYDKPDVILATSLTLQACKKSIQIAKKYKCKVVAEIADLWPESLIAYDIVGRYNPIVYYLRNIEKWIYKNADKVVFTMEGAYDYIKERKWERVLPIERAEYINNGVDLEVFEYNKNNYQIKDQDLEDTDAFKAIYVGAIRKANNVGQIIKMAEDTKDKNIKYIIYGSGDELEELKELANKKDLKKIVFKGAVDKKYIPYILSKGDISLFIVKDTPITRFGISPNKMFDYFAAGKPLLISNCKLYNPALIFKAGIIPNEEESLTDVLNRFYNMSADEMNWYCKNARDAANCYSFEVLTEKLVGIFKEICQKS